MMMLLNVKKASEMSYPCVLVNFATFHDAMAIIILSINHMA